MGKVYSEIDDPLRAFLSAQQLFFVATAPNGPEGHVNCSPKGLDTFRVLGPTTVAYVDYVGSGVETIAHLRQNGRIVLMFCSFEGAPKIIRLHGRGAAIEPLDPDFAPLLARFGDIPRVGIRSIVEVEVTRISDSCGFGVPRFKYEAQRDQMPRWAQQKGHAGLETYKQEKNAISIDGLEGLRRPSSSDHPR